MKKGLSYLVGAALNFGVIGTALAQSPGEIRRTTPVATNYRGMREQVRVPVYSDISRSRVPLCSAYAKRAASQIYGEDYAGGNAWNLRYHNRRVASLSSATLESLAQKEIVQPGMLVGIQYPRSRYRNTRDETGRKAKYTHVGVYIGNNKKGQALIAHQFGKKTYVHTTAQLKRMGLKPIEVLDGK